MATGIESAVYDALTHAHTAATTAKNVVVIGGVPMLPLNDASANEDNVFVYRAQKLRGPKAAVAVQVMDRIYWDDTNKAFTTSSGAGEILVGRAVEAAASGDAEVVIDFNPLAVN